MMILTEGTAHWPASRGACACAWFLRQPENFSINQYWCYSQDGDDVASLDLMVPHAPAVEQHHVTRHLWVQGRLLNGTCTALARILHTYMVTRSRTKGVDLHRSPLHPRHTGDAVEDGEGDRDGDEEPADEGPQVAPPRPRLLSHHLHR